MVDDGEEMDIGGEESLMANHLYPQLSKWMQRHKSEVAYNHKNYLVLFHYLLFLPSATWALFCAKKISYHSAQTIRNMQ